jgi:hypothetical protein
LSQLSSPRLSQLLSPIVEPVFTSALLSPVKAEFSSVLVVLDDPPHHPQPPPHQLPPPLGVDDV